MRFERQRAGMAVLEEQLQEQEELRAQKEAERRMVCLTVSPYLTDSPKMTLSLLRIPNTYRLRCQCDFYV